MVQVRDEPCIRLSWFNELLGNSQGRDQHLIYIEAIKQVLNLISSKDVIPNDTPLKLIRNFHEYVRLFIFSFIQYDPENNDNDEEGPIEIKISTMGVLAKEIQIKFWKHTWSISLKYIQDKTFRICFYLVGDTDGSFEHGVVLDLKCDQFAFTQFFQEIDIDNVTKRHPELDKSLFVRSFNLVDGENLLNKLRPSKIFNNYIYRY